MATGWSGACPEQLGPAMRKKVSSVHFCLRQRHPSTSVILSDTEGASAVRAAQDYFLLQVAASIAGVEQAFMPAVGTFPLSFRANARERCDQAGVEESRECLLRHAESGSSHQELAPAIPKPNTCESFSLAQSFREAEESAPLHFFNQPMSSSSNRAPEARKKLAQRVSAGLRNTQAGAP